MANPTHVVRGTPTGAMIPEGFVSKIAINGATSIGFFEISVQPFRIDGGEGIKTTTQFNVRYHTKRPQTLVEIGDINIKAGYAAKEIDAIMALINVEKSITQTWPDGQYCDFYGWLRSFAPDGLESGGLPTASIVICVSNWDATNKVEVGPVWGS